LKQSANFDFQPFLDDGNGFARLSFDDMKQVQQIVSGSAWSGS
jgi:hypothetical protein